MSLPKRAAVLLALAHQASRVASLDNVRGSVWIFLALHTTTYTAACAPPGFGAHASDGLLQL
jgi:hypothetical protein